MAAHAGHPDSGGYTSKKGDDDVPVSPCQGWFDPCEFCDKRFNPWITVDDEALEKVPEKPGIFMVALKNKNVTEVVNIIMDSKNIQKPAYSDIEITRERIADKKSKITKSVILMRWMVFKKPSDKEVCTLCAHWYNNGVLPKFLKQWPGLDVLQECDSLAFSKNLQKWCYPKKNPVWRKPKPPSTKEVEVIKKCNWFQPCEVCDFYFTPWRSLADIESGNLAPQENGLVMISVAYGKKREIVSILFDDVSIKMDIKSAIDNRKQWAMRITRNDKFVNKNANVEFRWMVYEDTDTDNSCYLYAHWLNADTYPMFNTKMPGEKALDKNKHFVCRVADKVWCYEIEKFKHIKFSKSKNKKNVLLAMQDDDYGDEAMSE